MHGNPSRFFRARLALAFAVPILFGCGALYAAGTDSPLYPSGDRVGYGLTLLLFFMALALSVSFLCSVAEAVLLSITPSYIEEQKNRRPQFAALLKRIKQDEVSRSLAAILTLNTVANTVGAIGAGTQAVVVFGSTWLGPFSAIMTLLILFFSEIMPKTIGATYWSKLANPTVHFVHALRVTLLPVVWLGEKLTQFISRGKKLHIFSRDEFVAMARVGEQTGQIGNNEARIIRNLFRFGSLTAMDIMTPRTVVVALPEDLTIREAAASISRTPFSRIPVHRGGIDRIVGFVLRYSILLSQAQGGGEETLTSLKRNVLFVPRSATLTTLLETFFKDRQHIAVVVDEYGGTSGVVTLEDLIETLMGMEIMDEMDTVEDLRALARKRGEQRAKSLTGNDGQNETPIEPAAGGLP